MKTIHFRDSKNEVQASIAYIKLNPNYICMVSAIKSKKDNHNRKVVANILSGRLGLFSSLDESKTVTIEGIEMAPTMSDADATSLVSMFYVPYGKFEKTHPIVKIFHYLDVPKFGVMKNDEFFSLVAEISKMIKELPTDIERAYSDSEYFERHFGLTGANKVKCYGKSVYYEFSFPPLILYRSVLGRKNKLSL
ncbi:hypothetical protein M0R04_15230 [Candidatus Dojkabacteria bacterium]|jgi:hypothetical protein|nr:hypothetical protein [Candidatus Dojkabacteria bacterium]